jgi:hypothetical protein
VTWFNYTPLAPLIEKYSDDGSRDLFSVECDLQNDGLYRVAAIGDHEIVQLIRVQSVNSDGSLTPEQARTVSQLVDHMISCVTFHYRSTRRETMVWPGDDKLRLPWRR